MDTVDDSFYAELLDRYNECQEELQERQKGLEQLQGEVDAIRRRAQAYATLLEVESGEEIGEAGVLGDLSGKSIPDAAIAVLSDPSVPPEGLHVRELVARMERRGWTSKAKKPLVSVAGTLNRVSVVERTQPNTFRVKAERRTQSGDGPLELRGSL